MTTQPSREPASAPQRGVAELLPHRAPEAMPTVRTPMTWKRYLLPLLLVSLALLINVLAWYEPREEAPLLDAEKPVGELTLAERLKAASSLIEWGDQLYDEGYSWLDNEDQLGRALENYREAWRLLTQTEYPEGQDASALLVDSVQCRTMHAHMRQRMALLTADLE